MTMYEPNEDRRTDTGVEFDEFLVVPILAPDDTVKQNQGEAGPDEAEREFLSLQVQGGCARAERFCESSLPEAIFNFGYAYTAFLYFHTHVST